MNGRLARAPAVAMAGAAFLVAGWNVWVGVHLLGLVVFAEISRTVAFEAVKLLGEVRASFSLDVEERGQERSEPEGRQLAADAAEEHRPEGARGFTSQREQGGGDDDADGDHHGEPGKQDQDQTHQQRQKLSWKEILNKLLALDERLRRLEEQHRRPTGEPPLMVPSEQ